MDHDVVEELHRCVEQAFVGAPEEALAAVRRARELLAWLEGRAVDLARAEGWGPRPLALVRRGPEPPDAA
jgi:hypothetical protein